MEGLIEEIENQGIAVSGPEHTPLGYTKKQCTVPQLDDEVGAVVVGYDTGFNFRKMTYAQHYISNRDLPFIAANPDMWDTLKDGRRLQATGVFLRGLEVSSGVSPFIVGKPNPGMIDLILKNNGLDESAKSKFVVIGD
jgi:ribonucleotide monophosphatase NagD (HAD superfamily)